MEPTTDTATDTTTAQQPAAFPTADDLPMLDAVLAADVLRTLRNMLDWHMLELYPPEDGMEWRVWLPMTRCWITLTEWQQELLDAVRKGWR